MTDNTPEEKAPVAAPATSGKAAAKPAATSSGTVRMRTRLAHRTITMRFGDKPMTIDSNGVDVTPEQADQIQAQADASNIWVVREEAK